MFTFLLVALVVLCAFALGAWLSPVVRSTYGNFWAWVESKLKLNEQRAKDKTLRTINKL